MRNRLFIALTSLLMCGANVALAQRQVSHSNFSCSMVECDHNSQCESIGCGNCGTTPAGQKRCKAAAEQ